MASHDSTLASTNPPAARLSTLAVGAAGAPLDAGGLRRVSRDDYVRGAPIAQGGMGRIVAAHDVRHDRPVAIKELLHVTPALVARFRREALIAARLQHPAIVPIYEAGVWDDGEPFFVMKRVEGRSLDRVIAATPALRDRLALLPAVIAVAEALAYAHARGVIHRDLKPHNVLVGAFGETVVIDWGLAKELGREEDAPDSAGDGGDDAIAPVATDSGELTVAGHALGTPAYMPPEQARGEAVGPRADVYALGAILYHLLAGMVPYGAAPSARDLLARVASVAPTPLRDLQLDVPEDLTAIVDKAMARDPADRYADAGALASDLQRFAAGQLVTAHRYSARALAGRWLRRHRVGVGAAAIVVVGALAGLILHLRAVAVEQADADRARRRAHDAQVEAETRLAEARAHAATLLEELGAERLVAGQPVQAARYLDDSHALGNRSATLRAMRAAAAPATASVPLRGHDGLAFVAGFTADATRVVTFDLAGTVRVLDPATGAPVATLDGDGDVRVAVAPMGTLAAASWPDGGTVFDTTDGEVVATLAPLAEPLLVAMSADGARVAVAGLGGEVQVADARTGETRWTVTTDARTPTALAFTDDGRVIVGAPAGGVVLASADGAVVASLPGRVVAIDPRGRRAVMAGDADADAVLVELATGARTVLRGAGGDAVVAFAPGGAWVATGALDAPTIHLWDAATGERAATLTGHTDRLRALAFDPATGRLVSAARDRTVRVWDPARRRQLAVVRGHGAPIDAVAWSPDGAWLATAGGSEPRVWPVAALQPARVIDGVVARGVAWSPDGAWVAATTQDGVAVIDPATGAVRHRIEVADAGLVAASADGAALAIAAGAAVSRWDPRTGAPLGAPPDHDGRVTALAITPDGVVITASHDRTIRAWDPATRTERWRVDTGARVVAAAVVPARRVIVSSSGASLDVWDLETGVHLHALPAPYVSALRAAAAGGAVVGTSEHETVVWDLAARARRCALDGHFGAVSDAALAPDGALIATAGQDGTARVWNAATGRPLLALEGHLGPVHAVALAPGGDQLASLGADGTLRLWDLRGR